MCRCACSQEKIWFIFYLDIRSHLNLDIFSKWNILLKLIVSATILKPLHKISWNFAVMMHMMSRCAYLREMLIPFFLGCSPLLNLEILPKWNILLKQFVSVTPLKMLHKCDNYKWIVYILYYRYFIMIACPIAHHLCMAFVMCRIVKKCWSVGNVSLLTISFIKHTFKSVLKYKKRNKRQRSTLNYRSICLSR